MKPNLSLAAWTAGLALVAPASAATQSAPGLSIDRDDCTVERVAPDGRRTVTPPTGSQASAAGGGSASASASSRAGGGSSASVSASSPSFGGRAQARSTATSTDAQGRSITTIHDGERCTIIVDERAVPGDSR
jgi:hypothetical protein